MTLRARDVAILLLASALAGGGGAALYIAHVGMKELTAQISVVPEDGVVCGFDPAKPRIVNCFIAK